MWSSAETAKGMASMNELHDCPANANAAPLKLKDQSNRPPETQAARSAERTLR
jgi:hypothetical protein